MSWIITGKEAGSLGLLDQYGGAAAAYSLRNLSLYYTDPVVRVRRDSDNAEQDFTATEVSDGTLAAWVGAGNNGFARTWYDQSGNGLHLAQTVAGSQPSIVSAGSLVTENGNPAFSFDGTDDGLLSSAYSQIGASAVSAFCVIQTPADATTKPIDFGYSAALDKGGFIGFNSGGFQLGGMEGRYDATNTFISGARGGTPTSNQMLATALVVSNSNTAFVNGAQIGQVSIVPPLDFNSSLNVGFLASASLYGAMKPQEVVIYHANQSANRAAIEASINAHYSIY